MGTRATTDIEVSQPRNVTPSTGGVTLGAANLRSLQAGRQARRDYERAGFVAARPGRREAVTAGKSSSGGWARLCGRLARHAHVGCG